MADTRCSFGPAASAWNKTYPSRYLMGPLNFLPVRIKDVHNHLSILSIAQVYIVIVSPLPNFLFKLELELARQSEIYIVKSTHAWCNTKDHSAALSSVLPFSLPCIG